ncbi:MAG: phosphoribosyltransferase family protein [Asgard group archaeon]|nr:phosphoribosyltransferase family protein [Asgard group archaeon]
METSIRVLDFKKIWFMVFTLFKKIKSANYDAEVIVGITRGGYVVIRLLSDFINLKTVTTIGLDFYSGIEETKKEPELTEELGLEITDKRVLLVDDVADTGQSMSYAVDYLKTKEPSSIITATIHYKPHSNFKPDFFVEETSDWLVYPWEWMEFCRQYLKNDSEKKKSIEQKIANLRAFSLPEIVIQQALIQLGLVEKEKKE